MVLYVTICLYIILISLILIKLGLRYEKNNCMHLCVFVDINAAIHVQDAAKS